MFEAAATGGKALQLRVMRDGTGVSTGASAACEREKPTAHPAAEERGKRTNNAPNNNTSVNVRAYGRKQVHGK